jgi:hypothetical protein
LTAICVGRVTVTTTSTPRYAASRSTLRSTTRMWVRGCVRPTGAGSTRRRPSSLRSQWWRSAARRRSTRRGRCWRDPAGGVRGDRRTTAMWSNLSSIQAMVTDRGPEACSRDLVTFGWCYASRSECWVLCSGRAWWVPVDWPGMVKVGVGQWQLAHRQLGDGCEARGEPAGQRVCMRRRRQSGVDHNLAPQVWSCHVPTGSAGSSRPHAAETQPGCAVTPQSTRTRALQPLA